MSLRFVLHIIVCIFFAGLGGWLYLQLGHDQSGLINSISLACYWFGYLVFLFFSWIFYWVVHKSSATAWIVAQFFALSIAIFATVSIVIISREHENRRQVEEEAFLQKQESQSAPSQDDAEDSVIVEEELELDQ